MGFTVHEIVRTSVECVDEKPHISAVVLEVEEEVVAYSTGSGVEQNRRKVFVQICVLSVHYPPHVSLETDTEIIAPISSGPVNKRAWIVLGENKTPVCLKVTHFPIIHLSHERVC